MTKTIRSLCALGLLASATSAQEILWQREGIPDVLWLGGKSAFLGDVDGDGWEDFATPAEAVMPPIRESQIVILSGRDGATLRVHQPPLPNYPFITQFAGAGDVDGDGVGDYAVTRFANRSPFGPNLVDVRSGRDDRLIWQVSGPVSHVFGQYLTGDLDLDGDGKPDLLVGAPQEPPSGAVHAYDNAGRLLYKVPIRPWGALGKMGDLDRDGCDDFVVGAWEPASLGAAFVFSGRSGQLLVTGYGQREGLGSAHNTGCGDVDGDGVLDFVSSSQGGFAMPGVARVFSGTDGHEIYGWRHPIGSGFGTGLATGDLDLDGISDLLVGPVFCGGSATSTTAAALEWRSLRDGSKTTEVCRPPPEPGRLTAFGHTVTIGPRQPGHPFPVFVVSDHAWGSATALPYTGRLTMFRAAPSGVAGLGPSCRGTLPAAPQLGLTALPSSVRLHLSGAPPSSPVFLALGISSTTWAGTPLPLSLHPLGFTGCSLYTSVELPLSAVTGSAGNTAGYAAFDLPLPIGSSLGVTLHGQALVLGVGPTAPGALSGALSWTH